MTDEITQTPETPQAAEPQQMPPPPAPAAAEVGDGKIFAFLCYLITIIGVLIVLLTKKEDKFAVYHAKQGLVLFITWIIVGVVAGVLVVVPILGWLIGFALYIIMVVLWIMGMVNALGGHEKPLPLIGQFGDKFNF